MLCSRQTVIFDGSSMGSPGAAEEVLILTSKLVLAMDPPFDPVQFLRQTSMSNLEAWPDQAKE